MGKIYSVIKVKASSQFPLSASSVNSCQYVYETNLKKNEIGLMSDAKQTDLLNGGFSGRKPFGVNWMEVFRLFFITATCCFATQNMSIYSKYRDVCNKLTSEFQ